MSFGLSIEVYNRMSCYLGLQLLDGKAYNKKITIADEKWINYNIKNKQIIETKH